MATWFTTERYYIQNNNDNAKSSTSKVAAKIKIKESKDNLNALERKMELLESAEMVELLKEAQKIQKCF